MRELLPEYATAAALGRAPERHYPQVAKHLKICAACRAELAELQQLTIDIYAGRIPPAAHYPAADLSFLSRSAATPSAPARPWVVDAVGRLIIVFSQPLIEALHSQTLAGGLRGQLIWRYKQERGSVDDLEVDIEAFAEDEVRGLAHVRVGVSIPSRDPFDQRGSQVTLRFGGETWQDATDDLGSVDFTHFPLASLPQLRVEITPQQTAGGDAPPPAA